MNSALRRKYFVVIAFSEVGDTLSNCMNVSVEIPLVDDGDRNGIPPPDGPAVVLISILISSVSTSSAIGPLFILSKKGIKSKYI